MNAQKVRITEMSRDYFRHLNVEGFEYLHEDVDSTKFQWIANVIIEFDTIQPTTIKELYLKMNERANRFGANAFRVLKSNLITPKDTKFIELSFYFLNYEDRKKNRELFQSNDLYFFGFLGHHKNIEGYKLTVQNEKFIVQELSYKLYKPQIGETIIIKLGKGFKSDEVIIKIEKDMYPRYYRFNVYKGLFSRNVIDEYEWSFGEFLIQILKKQTFIPTAK